ncbi:MAG: epoxyqueuosine reductase QueH [Clostridia bacterium]|nr:epoxyqueuosine reductase QueH [Clostridia bacterium]
MNKINFDKVMNEIIDAIKKSGERKKLLLHSCCAPCFCGCFERLSAFDLTVYFFNPNIDTKEEYDLRAEEQKRLCEQLGLPIIIEPFEKQNFLDIAKGLEKEREGGFRCEKCFNLRLKKTAEKCEQLNFDYFATTLTLSPLKNAPLINKIGTQIAEKTSVNYLPSDFKKNEGYKRSIELSKEFNLYRQNYCGCEFSKENK